MMLCRLGGFHVMLPVLELSWLFSQDPEFHFLPSFFSVLFFPILTPSLMHWVLIALRMVKPSGENFHQPTKIHVLCQYTSVLSLPSDPCSGSHLAQGENPRLL